LATEQTLLEMIFRESIVNQTVRVRRVPDSEAARQVVAEAGRRALCHGLVVGSESAALATDTADVASLRVSGPQPELILSDGSKPTEQDGASDSWRHALTRLVEWWA
jgi:hypothetical protein